jgi:hypothetical protein
MHLWADMAGPAYNHQAALSVFNVANRYTCAIFQQRPESARSPARCDSIVEMVVRLRVCPLRQGNGGHLPPPGASVCARRQSSTVAAWLSFPKHRQ